MRRLRETNPSQVRGPRGSQTMKLGYQRGGGTMSKLIETTILYLLLTAFAVAGVMYLAPKVGEVLSNHLEQAAHAGE